MVQKIRAIILIVIGIVALVLSIKCFKSDDLSYVMRNTYGGDAFTGIQNASATTANNVKELAGVVQFGFGSILLVMGLTLVGFGLTTPMGKPQTNSNPFPTIDEQVVETVETKEGTKIKDNSEA